MRYLENLSSTVLKEGPEPWLFKPSTPIPDAVRGNKPLRDEWINRPDTIHYVYSGNEGVNPTIRICAEKSDGSGNPIRCSTMLVGDYDRAMTLEVVLAAARGLPFPPNWIEKTLSGNWRFVWILLKPIIWPCHDFYGHMMKGFAEFAFDVNCLPGFDQGAWASPERMFTNSCEWHFIHDKPLSPEVVKGWMMRASAKFGFEKQGMSIPLDIVAAELRKRYPRFADWPGDFTLGAQGPTFFVEGSESPKSSIVRESGIQTFAAHATKSFYIWAELLGADFVRTYEAEALGRAVEGFYHDGKHYYRQLPSGLWKPYEKGDIMNHLIIARDVSQKVGKDGKSMLGKAIEFIQTNQNIDGAAPVWACPPGIIDMNGDRVLNTAVNNIMRPVPQKGAVWGAAGQFPWLSAFLDSLFSSPDQLEYFLAWLTHYYRCAFDMKPQSGQNVFLVGGVGVGKTFLTRAVVGGLVGGFAESKEYLMGEDQFGSELFAKGLWTIDDGSIATNPRTHKVFSEMIKRMAANKTFRYHAKFRVPTMVQWLGRVMISCNADEDSIRIIPDLDISILDKISIFRTVDKREKGYFPPPEEMQKILQRELGWLARWLLEHEIPAHLVGDTRFGVIAYHEASVMQRAQQSSSSAGFTEILEDWRQEYFGVTNIKAEYWDGTAFQLHKSIVSKAGSEAAMRRFDADDVGRHLSALKNKGATYIEILEEGKKSKVRKWRIFREDQPAPK